MIQFQFLVSQKFTDVCLNFTNVCHREKHIFCYMPTSCTHSHRKLNINCWIAGFSRVAEVSIMKVLLLIVNWCSGRIETSSMNRKDEFITHVVLHCMHFIEKRAMCTGNYSYHVYYLNNDRLLLKRSYLIVNETNEFNFWAELTELLVSVHFCLFSFSSPTL